ncbi:MAG: LacI family DNA-binding transcriptional regulator [Pseudobutyrivibrio sp.]|nr:LacI family DNA-binding transcriptional regulator [Pseudobutyrivibrio sp.]
MALTIYDISQKAGVSIATVSRVLNGNDNVKASTREKVLKVIEENDYTPNAFARGMGLGSMRTVGILCADSSDLFLAKAVYYLEQELQAHGYESLLCCTGYNQDSKKNYLDLILSKKVDSIILVGSNFIAEAEAENQYIMDASTQVPIMLLNAAFDYPNVYSTLCDDQAAVNDATASLINSGVKDVIYLYDSYSYSGNKKLKGFKAALKENGINDPDSKVFYFNGNLEDLSSVVEFIEKIAKKNRFRGVVTSCDALAVGAVKYAAKKGLSIPDDLSIIGYNDSIMTTCCTPELTSIDNKLETQTHQLIQTLLGVLNKQEMPTRSVFSGNLVKRGTTKF